MFSILMRNENGTVAVLLLFIDTESYLYSEH